MARYARVKTRRAPERSAFCLFQIGRVRRSRDGSVSQRAFAPDGRETYLDFALYGRRRAAG